MWYYLEHRLAGMQLKNWPAEKDALHFMLSGHLGLIKKAASAEQGPDGAARPVLQALPWPDGIPMFKRVARRLLKQQLGGFLSRKTEHRNTAHAHDSEQKLTSTEEACVSEQKLTTDGTSEH